MNNAALYIKQKDFELWRIKTVLDFGGEIPTEKSAQILN